MPRLSALVSLLPAYLDAAAAYLKDNPETICIVSGGQGSNEPFPEAVGMQRYLTENGVDPSRILPEDKSENTVMNIRYSKALISDPACSVGIVTNDFHMYRALMLARREGLQNAFGIAARSNPVFLPNNTLREVFGLAKDLLLK